MKHTTFLLLIFLGYCSYSQITHEVNVAVGQPDECVITSLSTPEFDITLYPNPATQDLTIRSEYIIEKITIIDVSGRILYSKKVNGLDFNLDVSSYQKGIYQCILKHNKGTQLIKFILQ